MRFYDVKLDLSESGKGAGEVVAVEEGSLQIAVKGGVLKIGKLRMEKGEKVGPTEFVKQVGLKVGDRFGIMIGTQP